MIFVDEIRIWPTAIRCFKGGSCHLFTDGTLDELHAFAKRLGLKRGWFQDHRIAHHYDLTPARRAKAVLLGATETTTREWLRRRRAAEDCINGGQR